MPPCSPRHGQACIAGAEDIKIDVRSRQAIIGDLHIREGDIITIDGSTGSFI